jgi:hypothetical protein
LRGRVRRLEFRDLLLLVRRHHVVRLETVLDVDGELAERGLLHLGGKVGGLGQIADMPHGCSDLEALAEIARNGLDLSGGLYDDELLAVLLIRGLCGHFTPRYGFIAPARRRFPDGTPLLGLTSMRSAYLH